MTSMLKLDMKGPFNENLVCNNLRVSGRDSDPCRDHRYSLLAIFAAGGQCSRFYVSLLEQMIVVHVAIRMESVIVPR